MILLQTDIPIGVSESFIDQWGAFGAILLLSLIAIYLLVKYIKVRNKEERTQLIKDKESNENKADVLYTEIKNMQQMYNDKQTDLLLQTHEIQSKTVEALNNTTDALNNNTSIFYKLIDKL